jgi:MerR family transcriptional regulator, aldehyde-responsive regulator
MAEQTGLTPHTLRYYERIGILPPPKRKSGGARMYLEEDVKFMVFINGLKKTGMSLTDINEFVKDGCIWDKVKNKENLQPSLTMRIEILVKHRAKMEAIKSELETVIATTDEKLAIYNSFLQDNLMEV